MPRAKIHSMREDCTRRVLAEIWYIRPLCGQWGGLALSSTIFRLHNAQRIVALSPTVYHLMSFVTATLLWKCVRLLKWRDFSFCVCACVYFSIYGFWRLVFFKYSKDLTGYGYVCVMKWGWIFLITFFTTVLQSHWDFSHGKFGLLSLGAGKASCDKVTLLNLWCMLGVLVFP